MPQAKSPKLQLKITLLISSGPDGVLTESAEKRAVLMEGEIGKGVQPAGHETMT